MVQRQTSAVPIDATQQQVGRFGVLESRVVQQRCCDGGHPDVGRRPLDKFSKDVDLVPSDVLRSSADEAVEVTEFDAVGIN